MTMRGFGGCVQVLSFSATKTETDLYLALHLPHKTARCYFQHIIYCCSMPVMV